MAVISGQLRVPKASPAFLPADNWLSTTCFLEQFRWFCYFRATCMLKFLPIIFLLLSCSFGPGNLQSKHSTDLETRKIRRIAVLRLSSLGDVILTLPVVEALARAWPQAAIEYWVMEEYAGAVRAQIGRASCRERV